MKYKITPIVPANEINKTLLDAIKKKQNGSDSLYAPAKKTGLFAASLRRVLETENSWGQAIQLYQLCSYLGLDLVELIEKEINHRKSNNGVLSPALTHNNRSIASSK